MLYDAQGQKVALQTEVKYLDNYIALQSLRFGNDVKIESDIIFEKETDNYSIEPMLLIPFVENAFKHGPGYSGQPSIDIKLSVNNEMLNFEVRNNFDSIKETGDDIVHTHSNVRQDVSDWS